MDQSIYNLFNEDVLKQAMALYQIKDDQIKKVGGFESFVYSFDKDNKEYILRITHSLRRSIEAIESEMEWIKYLHEQGVSCSLPYLSINNQYAEKIGDYDHPFISCAFDKVKGQHLNNETDTPDFRFRYGQLIGKMHRLSKNYSPKKKKRIQWFEDDLITNFEKIIPEDQTILKDSLKSLIKSITNIKVHKDNFGLVHYDAHMGNFFVENNEIHIFDFDDSQYAHFSSDIAIILFYYSLHFPPSPEKDKLMISFFEEFIKGYITENLLDPEEFLYIPLFLKLREFMLYVAIYNAYKGKDYDNWAKKYMECRKEKLENNIPFLSIDFYQIYKAIFNM